MRAAYSASSLPADNSHPQNADIQSEEQVVWARFRAGEQQAFEMLMTIHYRALFRYGSRFSNDPECIRDGIQDLFLHLWERRAFLHPDVSVKPYLLVSLRRIMHRKRTGMVFSEPLSDETESAFQAEFSVEKQFIDTEAVGQRANQLKKLLNTLPARQKEVIYLRYFQDLSRDQIAGVMTIAPQTVSNLMQLALKQLRKTRGIDFLLPVLWLIGSYQ